jgi:hypothetical protein
MRRYILLAMLLAWLGGALSAQNINRTFQLDKITSDLVEQLDKSTLKSGILLQKAPMFVNPFRYDGTTLSDSNTMDASTFGRLYGQLRVASVLMSIIRKSQLITVFSEIDAKFTFH